MDRLNLRKKSTTHVGSIREGAHLAALTKQPRLKVGCAIIIHNTYQLPNQQVIQKLNLVSLKEARNIL